MSRILFVTWDGAGNLVPTLALARRLAQRGHDVRMLGHRSIHERCGADGWRFVPFQHTAAHDSAEAHETDPSVLAREIWLSGTVAQDVRDELAREPADLVIGDCMLWTALCASHAAGVPTIALFHGAYALFRGGPFVDMVSRSLPALNALRQDLGLRPVDRLSDVHDACALSVVATPVEFEPDMPRPANVRFAGPLLDGPALTTCTDDLTIARDGDARPLVVVSFSTSYQHQIPALQRILGALAALPVRVVATVGPAIDPATLPVAANVEVVRYVPHDRVLPFASLVVTHAGLGTVMTTLAHGVPMVCVPLGRDQFFNAARVAALGVGRVLDANADERAIAAAVRAVIDDDEMRRAARRWPDVIAAYRRGEDVMAEIEGMAAGTRVGAAV
jgi:UDP:flavonoid glycosyltransferase YjiC (YdhE family)